MLDMLSGRMFLIMYSVLFFVRSRVSSHPICASFMGCARAVGHFVLHAIDYGIITIGCSELALNRLDRF